MLDGMVLKYRFKAFYEDGFVFQQAEDDKSLKFEGKSSFTDALRHVDEHGKIKTFLLTGPEASIGVDLDTGTFALNGTEVMLGDHPPPSPDVAELRLIFFRQHQENCIVGQNSETKTHTVRYCLGWQATVDGKNVQQIMGIF